MVGENTAIHHSAIVRSMEWRYRSDFPVWNQSFWKGHNNRMAARCTPEHRGFIFRPFSHPLCRGRPPGVFFSKKESNHSSLSTFFFKLKRYLIAPSTKLDRAHQRKSAESWMRIAFLVDLWPFYPKMNLHSLKWATAKWEESGVESRARGAQTNERARSERTQPPNSLSPVEGFRKRGRHSFTPVSSTPWQKHAAGSGRRRRRRSRERWGRVRSKGGSWY